MKPRILCVMSFLALAAVDAAWGAPLSIDSYAKANAGPYDLTTLGGLDWVAPYVDEKSSGTAIRTYGGSQMLMADSHFSIPGPNMTFSYTDGVGVPASETRCNENYDTPTMTATIDLPAGSGVVTAWLWTWAAGGEFTATFDDTTFVTHVTNGATSYPDKVVISYTTLTAQALVLKADGTNAGDGASFMGVAVSIIPEPSLAGLLGVGGSLILWSTGRKTKRENGSTAI